MLNKNVNKNGESSTLAIVKQGAGPNQISMGWDSRAAHKNQKPWRTRVGVGHLFLRLGRRGER